MKIVKLREPFVACWSGTDPFGQAAALKGQVFRAVKNRRTLRIVQDSKGYFAKVYTGVGWAEIIKNLLMFKLPIVSAGNEYRAIERLNTLNIATMTVAGFGLRGWNPASLESFLITEELTPTLSLEHFCQDWKTAPPTYKMKKALIETVASIVRTLHTNGVNHRDCYLCHFLLDLSIDKQREQAAPMLYVIDLHRTQIRRRTPRRWIIKDVAGLWFSAMDIGLTKQDRLRFIRAYTQQPLRQTLSRQRLFWRQVDNAACRLYKKEFGKSPSC